MRYKTLCVLLVALFMVSVLTIGSAQAATKDITLVAGWNLINTPLAPTNSTLTQVLTGIDYKTAWSWDATASIWKVYLQTGAADTETYAASKGFGTFSDVSAGEGWYRPCPAGRCDYH